MNYTYLALGDSYTIGEGVLLSESFPYQTVQLLRQTAVGATSRRQGFAETPTAVENPVGGWQFTAPEIIAKTGWTTDELIAAIQQTTFLTQYDMVSLLIGVNNQYRGRSAAAFEDEFTQLLQKAISFAGNNPAKVFVLSIPDWGVTPFAEGRDRKKIAEEIDAYNTICKTTAAKFNVHFIDITVSQRADGDKEAFLATDKLHPSGKEYAKWAAKLADAIKNI
jgi:lysophospholipase L1-like esterase